MAVSLQVTDIKYFSEIKNGSDFATKILDFGTHVKGNLIEKLRADITVRVQTRMELTRWSVTSGNTINLTSGNFIDEGFSVGDSVYLTLNGGGNFTINITSLSPTIMVTSGAVLPNGTYGNSSTDYLRSLTPLDAIKYKFGFPGNTDPTTFISNVDQTTLAFKAEGMRGVAPLSVTAEWDGTIKGSQTGGLEVYFIADVLDGGEYDAGGTLIPGSSVASFQDFKIEQVFNYPDWYLQNEIENITTGIRPDRIEAGLDLRQVVGFEFRTALSNPNTSKTGTLDWILGKTNYFGENYSDNATQYTVTDVVLTDLPTGATVSNIDVGSTTRITFSVLSANSTFITTDPIVAYHCYLPTATVYQDSTDTLTNNWILESLRETIDTAGSSGTVINNFSATLISASQTDCTLDITYPVGDQNRLDNGLNNLIAIGVADDTLSTDLSDKTVLPVHVGTYNKNNDVPGLFTVDKLEVYTHPMNFVDGVSSGFTDLNGWIQDGVMWDWRFSLDLSLTAVLERFRVQLVALKVADNSFFVLDSVEYNLSNQVIIPVVGSPTDVQAIEIDRTRGYELADGSEFNYVKLTTDNNDGTNQFYEGQTGFKINWQSWLELPEADTIFYDPAEEFNGFNNKASNYSLKEGYEIRVIINADVSQEGIDTNYIFKSPTVGIFDFEEQDGSPITWSAIKETFDTDGANLGGRIQTTADTDLKFTYTPDAAPGLASLYWGVIRIEEVNNPGFSICELSTFRASKEGNILKPLPGESFTKLSIAGGLVCLEATVDYTKLDPSKSYNIYGRMGLVDQTPVVIPTILREVDLTLTEGDQNWISAQQTEAMADFTFLGVMFDIDVTTVNFRTSSVEPGADQTDRANWNLGGVVDHGTGAAAFTAFTAVLAVNSTYYYFMETSDTAFIESGVGFTYEKLGSAVQPQTVVVNFPANSINNDFVIWFDKRVHITNLIPSQLSALTLELRTANAITEDWTDCTNTSTATFNTAVDSLGVGTNMACQFHGFRTTAGVVGSLQFDVEYIDDVDNEKAIVVTPNSFNGEWRPFDNPNGCIAFDKSNDAVNLGSGIMTQFMAIDNPFTMEYWFEASSEGFQAILSCTGDPGMGAQRGLAVSLISGDIRYQLREDGSTLLRRQWDVTSEFSGGVANGLKYCLIITKTTSNLASGLTAYLQGRKLTDIILDLSQISAGTTVTPDGTVMCHSSFQDSAAPLFVDANTNKSAKLRIYDRVLTDEEIRNCYLDIEAGASYAGLIRDYDFSGVVSSTLTDLTANENGTLVNHTNTATTFY